jgi:hypothetical protein
MRFFPRSPAYHARVAALAALVASVGDFLLLYIASSSGAELGLPHLGRAWLWVASKSNRRVDLNLT